MKFETKFKKKLNIKSNNMPIYDEKHIKAKVKQFNCVDNTNVWGDKVPNEGVHCTCIGTMNISSVMKIDKKTILRFI